jgi:tetratricopeptide (TPR) repeat protein
MGMLTGDIEAHVRAGAISLEHGRRLWGFTPQSLEALYYHAPELVGLLLPARPLIARAEMAVPGAPWLSDLRRAAAQVKHALGDRERSQLLSMVSDVLLALARERPLLILLDDLQWVDTASADLLFHLARRLAGSRIFILGAYRPDEVDIGREDRRHPLQPILNELQRLSGQNWLDLDQITAVEGQNFINALLVSQPNRLDGDFRRMLFKRTGGNPLFTVELIRAMRDRGDLLIDEGGFTIAGPTLNWDQLPAQVEGVLKERIERLDAPLRQILQAACVEGEDFAAQIVAQVLGVPERELLAKLSDDLQKRHRLVAARGRRRVSDLRLSIFGFRHNLFQQYLYHSLSEAERTYLHEDVGNAQEALYGEQAPLIAGLLGYHFRKAGRVTKAINYLLEAGDQARLLYAHQEAIGYYRQALTLLEQQGDDDRAARTFMKVGLTHHNAYDFKRARRAYKRGFVLWQRASSLDLTVPPPPAPHAFRAAINRASLSLDPAKVRGNHEVMILDHLFSGLVHQSAEMDIMPHVAHSWEVSDGGRTYIFHLRDDANWTDGMPLTAADFEFAWKRVLNPATESLDAGLLYDIRGASAYHEGQTGVENVGVTAVDGVTLRVELQGPRG